jgi:hypothetical protein
MKLYIHRQLIALTLVLILTAVLFEQNNTGVKARSNQTDPLIASAQGTYTFVNSLFGSGVVSAPLQSTNYRLILTEGGIGLPSTATISSASYQHQPGFLAGVQPVLPNVTVEQAGGQLDPTTVSPINFTATFSEPINVSSFTNGDVALGGAAGATTAVITQLAPNDGTKFNIAVSGMTGSGTVTASLGAAKVTDLAGNANTASTGADNTVTYAYEPDTLCEDVPSITLGQDHSDGLIAPDDIDVYKFEVTEPQTTIVAKLTPPASGDFALYLFQGCDGSDQPWDDGRPPRAVNIGIGGNTAPGDLPQDRSIEVRFNVRNDLVKGTTYYLAVQALTGGSYSADPYLLNVQLVLPNVSRTGLADSDGDGLPDIWENSPDLLAMGADPQHKDIFVELDYMADAQHSHQPKPAAMAKIVQAFANAPVSNPDGTTGIRLHVDYGPESEMNPVTHAPWGALSQSNSVPHTDSLGKGWDYQGTDHYDWTAFDAIKTANFSNARAAVFHYGLFAHNLGDFGATSGVSRGLGASDFIVSLGDPSWNEGVPGVGTINEQAGTFMHELGHNLGLFHGGNDQVQYKPNFLSIMNYSFQTRGLSMDGMDGYFDYSRFDLPVLDETHLNELPGLNAGPSIDRYGTIYYCASTNQWTIANHANGPLDWNCNGNLTDPNVQADVNNDTYTEPLTSYNEWPNLIYAGGSIGAFGFTPETLPQTPFEEITQAQDALLPSPYKVSVTASDNQLAPTGSAVQLTFTLRNLGTQPDTYTLLASSSAAWANLVNVPPTLTLAAGQSAAILVPVQVPASARNGAIEKISLTIVSQTNANIEDQAVAMVTAVDTTTPVVLSVVRANSSPTSAPSVNFTVTFSEPVNGVDATDFKTTASGVSGTSITAVSGSGATRVVTVKTGSGNGTLRLDVVDNDSIVDRSGNPLGGPGAGNGNFSGGQVYTIDKTVTLTLTSIAAQDGWILESGHNTKKGGALNATATTFNLGDDKTKKQYRGILSFSTGAALPDNAVITGVTLKIKQQAIVGGGNPVSIFQGFMFDIKNGFFGAAATLQTGDFQAAASQSYGPSAPAPVGGWYSFNLVNAKNFVNKLSANSGLTQIRLRFKLDDNHNAIANYLSLYSGNAPAANRPQLIIQYYVP